MLEEQAGYANRKGTSRHHPAEPLYSEVDATCSLRQLQAVPFEKFFEPVTGVRATLRMQGHILGAAAVTLEYQGVRVTFSGDIVRPHDPVMLAPVAPADSDRIVTESTYDDRAHSADSPMQQLGDVLRRVAVSSSFLRLRWDGRSCCCMFIAQLQTAGEVPRVPLFLNSPMATDVTALYRQYPGFHRLDAAALVTLRHTTQIVNSIEQSKALNRRHGPMVIVSASGMATGGCVLHHLKVIQAHGRTLKPGFSLTAPSASSTTKRFPSGEKRIGMGVWNIGRRTKRSVHPKRSKVTSTSNCSGVRPARKFT